MIPGGGLLVHESVVTALGVVHVGWAAVWKVPGTRRWIQERLVGVPTNQDYIILVRIIYRNILTQKDKNVFCIIGLLKQIKSSIQLTFIPYWQ